MDAKEINRIDKDDIRSFQNPVAGLGMLLDDSGLKNNESFAILLFITTSDTKIARGAVKECSERRILLLQATAEVMQLGGSYYFQVGQPNPLNLPDIKKQLKPTMTIPTNILKPKPVRIRPRPRPVRIRP
jgi:hypothetical protein